VTESDGTLALAQQLMQRVVQLEQILSDSFTDVDTCDRNEKGKLRLVYNMSRDSTSENLENNPSSVKAMAEAAQPPPSMPCSLGAEFPEAFLKSVPAALKAAGTLIFSQPGIIPREDGGRNVEANVELPHTHDGGMQVGVVLSLVPDLRVKSWHDIRAGFPLSATSAGNDSEYLLEELATEFVKHSEMSLVLAGVLVATGDVVVEQISYMRSNRVTSAANTFDGLQLSTPTGEPLIRLEVFVNLFNATTALLHLCAPPPHYNPISERGRKLLRVSSSKTGGGKVLNLRDEARQDDSDEALDESLGGYILTESYDNELLGRTSGLIRARHMGSTKKNVIVGGVMLYVTHRERKGVGTSTPSHADVRALSRFYGTRLETSHLGVNPIYRFGSKVYSAELSADEQKYAKYFNLSSEMDPLSGEPFAFDPVANVDERLAQISRHRGLPGTCRRDENLVFVFVLVCEDWLFLDSLALVSPFTSQRKHM